MAGSVLTIHRNVHRASTISLVRMGLALDSHEDNRTYSNESILSIIMLPRKDCSFSRLFFPVQMKQAIIFFFLITLWKGPCGKLPMEASTVQLVWS